MGRKSDDRGLSVIDGRYGPYRLVRGVMGGFDRANAKPVELGERQASSQSRRHRKPVSLGVVWKGGGGDGSSSS